MRSEDENRLALLLKTARFNLSILALILLVELLPFDFTELLSYKRSAIMNGELWRLLSGQLLHTNFNHAILNASGLLLIIVSFHSEQKLLPDITAFAICATAVATGLIIFAPNIEWYKGFSGVLHGYLIYYLCLSLNTTPKIAKIALALITLKLIWEQTPYADLSATENLISSRVATEAHLSGAVGGLLIGLWAHFKPNAHHVARN